MSHAWIAPAVVLPLIAAAAALHGGDTTQLAADPHSSWTSASTPAATKGTGGPPAVVPFLFRNNHIMMQGTIAGSDSLWFILDTGAGANVIDRGVADRLKLELGGGVAARGAGGSAAAAMVQNAGIQLPGTDLTGTMHAAIDLSMISLRTGFPCDGVVGAPFFQRYVVEIDYAASVLRVHDRETFTPGSKEASVPITFMHNHPYVEATLTLPGGEQKTGTFLLDTGSTMALILEPSFAASEKVVERMPRTLKIRMGGVGGEGEGLTGRLPAITLGGHELKGPIASLRPDGSGHTSVETSLGNIGGEILRRFVVTFDYGRNMMYVRPGGAFGEPFEGDMLGALFTARNDSTRALEAVLVQERSPASERGIQVGDVLEKVDGKPVKWTELADLRRELRTPGRAVKLGLRRDGKPVDVTVELRRMI